MKNTKVMQWGLAALPLILLGIMTAIFYGKSLHRDPQVQTHALVGKPAPTVAMASLEGAAPMDAATAAGAGAGGPYVVNFFASWCGPCATEQPTLLELKARGVRIVGVNYKDKPEDARAFLAKFGDPFVARLTDPDGRAGIEFGVSAVPESFLVGANGIVLAKASLPLTPSDAKRLMDQLSKDRPL